jgi:hypothetical protein
LYLPGSVIQQEEFKMAKKIVKRDVHVPGAMHGHEDMWLHPGDEVPQWAEELVTNPRVFEDPSDTAVDFDDPSLFSGEAGEDSPNYFGMKVDELKALLEERGLASGGNKTELIQRLEDHDAAVG